MPKGNRTNHTGVQPPRTFKDTFWNKQRVAKNLTIKEVAEMLGINDARVGMWFTGQLMPQDYWIKDLCKLFEVDYNEGQLAFQKAHLEWSAEHNLKGKMKYIAKTTSKKKKTEQAISDKSAINNIAEVVLALYGNVSCETFLTVYNAITSGKPDNCDIEQLIYGKVSFEQYQQIIAIMKS